MAVINILCQTKRWFAFSKIGFYACTKGFEDMYGQIFELAQNILEPVKGQGISIQITFLILMIVYNSSLNFRSPDFHLRNIIVSWISRPMSSQKPERFCFTAWKFERIINDRNFVGTIHAWKFSRKYINTQSSTHVFVWCF